MALPIDPATGLTYVAEQGMSDQTARGMGLDPVQAMRLRNAAAWGDPNAAQTLSSRVAYQQPLMSSDPRTLNPGYTGPGANILPSQLPSGGSPSQTVTDLYQSILGRTPDPGGLQTWTNALGGGKTPDWLATQLANSPEGQARSASLTPPAPASSSGPASQPTFGGSNPLGLDFSSIMQSLSKGLSNLGGGAPVQFNQNPAPAPGPRPAQQPQPGFQSSGSGLPNDYIRTLAPAPITAQGIGAALGGGS